MTFFNRHKRFTRNLTKVVIFLFCFQLVAPGVAMAQITAATPGATASVTTGTIMEIKDNIEKGVEKTLEKAEKKAKEVKDSIEKQIWDSMKLTAALTTRNALVLLAREAAKESLKAMQGKGDPQFYEDSWKKFQKDIVDNVTGKFLDGLRTAAWDSLGFDICDPNLELKLEIVAGLDIPKDQKQEKPICTFTKIKGNYEALGERLAEQYHDLAELYRDDPRKMAAFMAGKMLESGWENATTKETSDIGIGLTVTRELKMTKQEILDAEEKQRIEGQGMKAKTNTAGDKIQTPAWLRRGFIMNEVTAVQEVQKTGMDPALHVMDDIPAAVIGAFLTTFVGEGLKVAMQKLLEYGVTDDKDEYVPPQGNVFGYSSQQKRNDKIERTFGSSSVTKVSVNYNPKEINLLSDFVSCPQNPTMFNCVMDQNFAQAVRMATQLEPLTVAQAIEEEYLDGSKPIIHRNEDRNNTDECYETGYCYSNLVKLRTARVIPIGWEIAASIVDTNGMNISLNTVIEGFNVPGSPYEGLINPNWILKYPKAKCELKGYGEELVASATSSRSEYCADVKTCIDESDNGECEAWGYCAAEKNSWKFGGKECFAPYDSCKSLKMGGTGSATGYIYKTVDNRDNMCNAGNAGCAWYALTMTKTTDEWNWEKSGPSMDHDNISSSIIRLNNNINEKTCSNKDEGCTQVIRTKADNGTNQVLNSSFEEYTGALDTGTLVGGINCDGRKCDLNGEAFSGDVSVAFDGGGTLYGPEINTVYKKNKRYFVVSAFIEKKSSGSVVEIDLNSVKKGNSADLYMIKEGIDSGYDYLPKVSSSDISSDSWERIYTTFEITPDNINANDLEFLRTHDTWIQPTFGVAGGAKIDDIMVEEISFPAIGLINDYIPYGSDSGINNIDYVTKAPAYLGCYAAINNIYGTPYDSEVTLVSAATNEDQGPFPRGCENFASVCTAKEVGCDAFAPTDGGEDVSGIVSSEDYCPSECAGYKAFKKNETFYEQEEFPIYLITRSADKCDAQNVGCEEFTNLDKLASGGEAQEYYKQLKHCVKVPENESSCSMYFTWESSEDAGYQLKAHYLEADSTTPNTPAVLDNATNSASCNADIFARKSASNSNPDCLEYYDEDGNASYRLSSQVVTCSENCHPYRRTIQYQTYSEFSGTQFVYIDAASQCEQRKGTFQTDGECIFMAIPGEGISCDSDSAGCREYGGNYSGDEQILFETNFSDMDKVIANLDYDNSDGSQSMRVESRDQGPILVWPGVNQTLSTNLNTINLLQNKTGNYILSFWIKTDGHSNNSMIKVSVKDGTDSRFNSGDVSVSTDWEYKTFSFNVDNTYIGNEVVEIQSIGDHLFFIDNYKLSKVNDISYLIKDSWDIPVTCDNELTSNSPTRDLPRAMVGCREYTDSDNTIHYLKGFSSLCDEDKVGCEAVIDTKNSQDYQPVMLKIAANSPPEKWSGGIAPGTTVLSFGADEWLYLVLNDDSRCASSAKGCTAVGKPELTITTNGTVTSTEVASKDDKDIYKSYFYIIDPDDLVGSDVLCANIEEGCETFTDKGGSDYYFKNPYDRVCEYRQGTVGGVAQDGWFIKKTDLDTYSGDIFCQTSDYYYDGTDHVVRNDDPAYDGFVGLCENKADKCTAFLDPTDRDHAVANNDPDLLKNYSGKPYYYLNDENFDKTSCSSVDRNIGCVMFNNTSENSLNGNSYQTYYNVRKSGNPESVVVVDDTFLDSIITEAECTSPEEYTYCRTMEACLAIYESSTADMVNDCLAKIAEIDAAPGVSDVVVGENPIRRQNQYVCSDGGNVPDSLALMDTNARCTARKLLADDSNVIIKVEKDRSCASWYGCKSTHYAWDSSTSSYMEECDELGLCDSLDSDGKCTHFITSPLARNLLSNNEPIQKTVNNTLDYSSYKTRNTGWFDLDYTGYAIVDRTPLNFYTAIDVNTKYCFNDGSGAFFLDRPCVSNSDCGGPGSRISCRSAKFCNGVASNGACNVDSECNPKVLSCPGGEEPREYKNLEGFYEEGTWCINNETGSFPMTFIIGQLKPATPADCVGDECSVKCEYPTEDYRLVNYKKIPKDECERLCKGGEIDGINCMYINGRCLVNAIDDEKPLAESTSISCRVYPEQDSPFPVYIKEESGYENVNIITLNKNEVGGNKEINDFGCFYTSYQYGSDEKSYPNYPEYNPSPDTGFCSNDATRVCTCDPTPRKIEGSDAEGLQALHYPVIDTDQACSTRDCSDDPDDNSGLCSKPQKDKTRYSGLSGYCLQYDTSTVLYDNTLMHPCLTWYPTNNMQGVNSLRDNQQEAGFTITDEYAGDDKTPSFCLEAERWEKRSTYIARTDGSLSCGDYADFKNLSVNYNDELSNPIGFPSPHKEADSFGITKDIGNMMNTRYEDDKPSTIYDNDRYWRDTNGVSIKWWDFFHENTFATVYDKFSENNASLHDGFPNIPDNSHWAEYDEYFNKLDDAYEVPNEYGAPLAINQKAFDSLTLTKAMLRSCGLESNGDTRIENPWRDSFGVAYEGPKCPDGYRPGQMTFYDARWWQLFQSGSTWRQIANVLLAGGLGAGDIRDVANTLVTHHECIPEFTGYWDDINDHKANMSWYYDNDKNFGVNSLYSNYTSNGSPNGLSIESSTGEDTFCDGCPFVSKNQCEDGIDNDGDGGIDYGCNDPDTPLCPNGTDGNCGNPRSNCEYNSCVVSEDYRYGTSDLSDENLCDNDGQCKEKFSELENEDLDQEIINSLRCLTASDSRIKYCHFPIDNEINPRREYSTKEYKEPNPVAIKHLPDTSGQEPSIELNEVDAPVCSKYVEIPESSPIYTDHYYKLKSGINLSGLTTCNAYEPDGTMANLGAMPVDSGVKELSFSQGYRGNNQSCSFLGALPEYSVPAAEVSAFFTYKYLKYGVTETSAYNSSSLDCGVVSGDSLYTDDKTAKAGGTMCFNYNSEYADSSPSAWQLRKIFALAGTVYKHVSLEDNSKGVYAWNYEIDAGAHYTNFDPDLPEFNRSWNDLDRDKLDSTNSRVYAPVVMGAIVSTDDSSYASTAVPNTITVVTGDTTSYGGEIDILNSQAEVAAKFYAWADRNAMPITKVKVDWGDGTEPTGPSVGQIKNHKPICQRRDHELLGLCQINSVSIPGYACSASSDCVGLEAFTDQSVTCSSDKYDNWGDTYDSCSSPKPFEYTHAYSCTSPESLGECLTSFQSNCYERRGDNNDELWCRFKPKVVVFDNWNWCNQDTNLVAELGNGLNHNDNAKCNATANNNVGQWYDGYIYMKPESAADVSIEELF
jgi:hypothetical protein